MLNASQMKKDAKEWKGRIKSFRLQKVTYNLQSELLISVVVLNYC